MVGKKWKSEMTSEALQNPYFVRLYCKNIDKTHSLTEPNDKIQFHGNYFFKNFPLNPPLRDTVQITFIFIGQTHLVFGKRVCTCVMKHSNAFRTFLNWLKNSKRVWHERKLHIMRVPLFANFDR